MKTLKLLTKKCNSALLCEKAVKDVVYVLFLFLFFFINDPSI